MNRFLKKPHGYSLLLGIILLTTMLTISLTVTTLLIRQVQLAEQVVFEAQALAAADAGTERALYLDFHSIAHGSTFDSGSPLLPPFGATTTNLSFSAQYDTSNPNFTTLKVQGISHGTQRALQLSY